MPGRRPRVIACKSTAYAPWRHTARQSQPQRLSAPPPDDEHWKTRSKCIKRSISKDSRLKCTNAAKRSKQDEENWRSLASNTGNLLRIMYEKKISTDLVIKVGSGNNTLEIECHSVILAAHSPVFEGMLSERWGNTKNRKSAKTNIVLPDDDPEDLKAFIDMLYSDWNNSEFSSKSNDKVDEDTITIDVEEEEEEEEKGFKGFSNDSVPEDEKTSIEPETAIGIFVLAQKYMTKLIYSKLEPIIHSILCQRQTGAVVKLYISLKRFQIDESDRFLRRILRKTENYILGDAKRIFSSSAINEFSYSELADLVGRDQIRCPEDVLYNGCVTWAKELCKQTNLDPTAENLRNTLRDITYRIRFPLIDNKLFVQVVMDSDILLPEEKKEIIDSKLNKNDKDQTTDRFSINERVSKDEFVLNRLDPEIVSDKMVDFSTHRGFVMTVSKTICISSLWFYCGDGDDRYVCRVVFEYESKYGHRQFVRTSVGRAKFNKFICLEMKRSVRLPKDVPVSIKFTIAGGKTYCAPDDGHKEMKEVGIWNEDVISFSFKQSSLPNGLIQIPIMGFTVSEKKTDGVDTEPRGGCVSSDTEQSSEYEYDDDITVESASNYSEDSD